MNEELWYPPSFRHDAEPGGHFVLGQFVAAAGAELVGGAHRTEAVSAACGELIVALGTEVKITLHEGAASRATRDQRLPQQVVEHGPDPAGHHKTDQHPESRTHGAARGVFADVADHEEIQGGEQSPGEIEVDLEADRRTGVMALRGEHPPHVILDGHKGGDGGHNRPPGDQAGIFVYGNKFWFAHVPSLTGRGSIEVYVDMNFCWNDAEVEVEVAHRDGIC